MATLLTLHGFLGGPNDWESLSQKLDNVTVKSVDLLTLNLSHFHSASESLLALMDPFLDQPVFLMGYSMGGRLALDFACRYPKLLTGLILESSSAGIEEPDERAYRHTKDLELAKRMQSIPWPQFVSEWYCQPLFESLRTHDHFEAMLASRNAQDPAQMARLLKSLSIAKQVSRWVELPHLDLPTLLITGEKDAKYCEIAHRMKQLMPKSRAVTIPHAGHNCHLENIQDMVVEIADFIMMASAK